MVDNLAEKVDECPLNRGRRVLLVYNLDRKNCPLYGVAGCPLFRGCLSIEVNGRTVGTFRIVCYIMGVRFSGVSVKRGSTVYVTLCTLRILRLHTIVTRSRDCAIHCTISKLHNTFVRS